MILTDERIDELWTNTLCELPTPSPAYMHLARLVEKEAQEKLQEEIAALKNEILKLHSQLAHEKLRADTGWQRYESANRAHMATLNIIGLKKP